MHAPETATVMNSGDIGRALRRIAHEIVENHRGVADLVLLGIPRRGVFLAQALAQHLQGVDSQFDVEASVGALDVTMYRDDLRSRGPKLPAPTVLPTGGVTGKTVVLVDDVLFSGRTIRAAMDALSDVGRPQAVRLATLVDRGHREFPIRADFVGKNLPTGREENVRVFLADVDDVTGEHQRVVIEKARS